jgi:putative DeoR family transcriptional regulator (stage III sporulation protein D)
MSQYQPLLTHYCERCEKIGRYILANNLTVRGAATYFALSKSTVHKDVTVRLRTVNPALFAAVREVLERNKSERHIRGGDATRLMYLSKKSGVYEKSSSQ